ncbi:hypothetical protein, partial [Sulfitobacter pontiacus]|uniref:hypothetical protein n=1 Tax=Sulfitobacter pontiacus TaxID=60137 RepID=UPI00241E5CCA
MSMKTGIAQRKRPGQRSGCPGEYQRRAGRQLSLDWAGHAPGRARRQFRRNCKSGGAKAGKVGDMAQPGFWIEPR